MKFNLLLKIIAAFLILLGFVNILLTYARYQEDLNYQEMKVLMTRALACQ